MKDGRLSYDEIVELVVDSDDKIQPWSLRQEAKIAVALRELRQRREDERVSETLAGAAKHLPAPLSSNLESALLEFLRTRKWGDLGDAFRAGWTAREVDSKEEIDRLTRERDQALVISLEVAQQKIPAVETKPSQGLMGRIENLAANNLTGCGTCSTIIDEIRRSEKTGSSHRPIANAYDTISGSAEKATRCHCGRYSWVPDCIRIEGADKTKHYIDKVCTTENGAGSQS